MKQIEQIETELMNEEPIKAVKYQYQKEGLLDLFFTNLSAEIEMQLARIQNMDAQMAASIVADLLQWRLKVLIKDKVNAGAVKKPSGILAFFKRLFGVR